MIRFWKKSMIFLLIAAFMLPTITLNIQGRIEKDFFTYDTGFQCTHNKAGLYNYNPPGNDNSSKYDVEVDDNASDEWYDDTHVKTIEEALDIVPEDGKIFVHEGNYQPDELLEINKPLKLIGENNLTTFISGNKRYDVIAIKSSNVQISNFTIRWSSRNNIDERYAGIRIRAKLVHDQFKPFSNITISNNIICNNTEGIFISRCTHIKIINNTICNNDFDGIVIMDILSRTIDISRNKIYKNGYTSIKNANGDGISIWTSNYINITKNHISNNKIDGIWVDGDAYSSHNINISENVIEENEAYGIHFDVSTPEPPENNNDQEIVYHNVVRHNYIKKNKYGGILIRHSKENDFYENTIEHNKGPGFTIVHTIFLTCTDNNIYHNNFIENGEFGIGKFFKDYSKYCNGVDNNKWRFIKFNDEYKYNNWDNGVVDDKNNKTSLSKKGGNYWSDYEQCYGVCFADEESRYCGTWNEAYGMRPQISFKILNRFFSIPLNRLKSNKFAHIHDENPWCRMNGWNPSPPDKPYIGDSHLLPNKHDNKEEFKIICSSTDPNRDMICYEFSIRNDDTNETHQTWQPVGNGPVWSGNSTFDIFNFYETGNYTLFVRAWDSCDNTDNNGKGYDMKKSEISQLSIKVPVIN